ncbi:MAG: hypothetical protein SNF33_02165 [Candidatus Algichlamydia australiensis]|nr:hypothetical protein [Chlamydiales bacterium]
MSGELTPIRPRQEQVEGLTQPEKKDLNALVQLITYLMQTDQMAALFQVIGDDLSDKARAELYGKVKSTKHYQQIGAVARGSEIFTVAAIVASAVLGSPIDSSIISSIGRSAGEGASAWFNALSGESQADQQKAQRGVEKASGEKQTLERAKHGNDETCSRLAQMITQVYTMGQ